MCPVAYKIKCDKDIKASFHPSLDSTDLKTCTKCPNWSPCPYLESQRAVVESDFPWFRPKTQNNVNFLGGSFNLPKFPNSKIEGLIPLGLGCYDETLCTGLVPVSQEAWRQTTEISQRCLWLVEHGPQINDPSMSRKLPLKPGEVCGDSGIPMLKTVSLLPFCSFGAWPSPRSKH